MIPRHEHPDPQFERDAWVNLNGQWSFAFDPGKSGREAGWMHSTGFDREITVPFCPESSLSGVGHTDFIEAMWYHRTFEVPRDWDDQRVLLHFGGVDYESEIYVDGKSVGLHFGGTVGFTCDITNHVTPGQKHNLVVRVHDDVRSGTQPCGKQCRRLHSFACSYTRTTGIWQTVWLEGVHPHGLRDVHVVPDLDGGRFIISPRTRATTPGLLWRVTIDGCATTAPLTDGAAISLPLANPLPWSPSSPHLYDLLFEVLHRETVIDSVRSYAGLRKVHIEDDRVYLNNSPIFQRLVLDQGFYPDGIWTAPSDAALKRDIELSMTAGFNGARLHQKVFEPRFHYWADKLGYLTWGEASSWGIDPSTSEGFRSFLPEWTSIVERDRNHPSIIAWTPLNETWQRENDAQHRAFIDLYEGTKLVDATRPINTASGGNWYRHDLTTLHCYDQDPEVFAKRADQKFGPELRGNYVQAIEQDRITGPLIIDEYGGTWWNPTTAAANNRTGSWGYGNAPKTEAECLDRIDGLTKSIVERDLYCGYCYTQLTDVEQEQNGIYFYDRTPKFDMKRVRGIFGRKPEWSQW